MTGYVIGGVFALLALFGTRTSDLIRRNNRTKGDTTHD